MTNERKVYLLNPKLLNPETIAVTFGKTSRSPLSFEEIAAELTDEKTHQFHEKWVVGYGHASIAEHAVLHVAVENISRLAVECLESNRLASYTEKSTRYQKWNSDSFHFPVELEETPLKQLYLDTCQVLFTTYQSSLPVVQAKLAELNPKKPEESDAAWERRLRTETIDVCRFLLPAASLANVGMTINARTLEHAISKMLSHPLAEVRNAGLEMKKICQAEAPTLIKYVDALPYLLETGPALKLEGNRFNLPDENSGNWCRLIACDPQMELQVIAAALYRYGNASFEQYLQAVQNLSVEERSQIMQVILEKLGKHDDPLRELEYASYTFDLVVDQGGYFELKRHRIMTQSPQSLTTKLGYAIPRMIYEAGLLESYTVAMEKAAEAYEKIAIFNADVASYLVPNAFNRRLLMQLNLRTADHLLALRSAPNAHFSMRRVAQRMTEEIRRSTPLLSHSLRTCTDETWQGIEEKYFYKV
jgi:thymidylate synthase ThyX